MPPEPLVSLIMPARAPRADWLRAAVESALGQVSARLELIVVDDGSAEPVADLLADLDDPRLRLLRIDHGGVSRARNAGLAVAGGDYVRFVDADDVLEPGSTSRMLAVAGHEPGAAIAYGATLNCDEALHPLRLMESDLEGWIVEECLLYRFDVRCMSMLFPRSVVDAVGDWDPTLRHCQDWDYVLRALEHAPARRDAAVATFYRRHAAAQTTNLAAMLDHEQLVVDRYFERHPGQAGTRLERRARAQLLRVRADHGAALGQTRAARLRTLGRALALDPPQTAAHIARHVRGRLAATASARRGR